MKINLIIQDIIAMCKLIKSKNGVKIRPEDLWPRHLGYCVPAGEEISPTRTEAEEEYQCPFAQPSQQLET